MKNKIKPNLHRRDFMQKLGFGAAAVGVFSLTSCGGSKDLPKDILVDRVLVQWKRSSSTFVFRINKSFELPFVWLGQHSVIESNVGFNLFFEVGD